MLPYSNNNNIITNDEVLRLKHKQLKNIKKQNAGAVLEYMQQHNMKMPSISILHLVDCRVCLMNFYTFFHAHKIKFNI